jgi:hypothetical protein
MVVRFRETAAVSNEEPGRRSAAFLFFFPTVPRVRRLPLRSDTLKKNAGGFVMRVSRHKLAPERLGEDGLVPPAQSHIIGAAFGRLRCRHW